MKYSEYSEEKRHGIRAFPVEYHFLTEDHPQYVMPPHWHKEFEILRVISGEITLHLNNKEHLLRAGDIIFYGSETLHRGEPRNCVYECIVFDAAILSQKQSGQTESIIRPLLRGETELSCHSEKEDTELKAVTNRLFDTLKSPKAYYELRVLSLMYEMFFELYSSGLIVPARKQSSIPKQTRIIITTLSWIEEHYNEQITLTRLSEIAGVNEKYLCRIFKEYTSKSPINYINEYRIDCACRQMTVEGKSVTQAAYDCGFNDSGYFSRTFKKYKGVSPTEYRSHTKRGK